MELVVRRHRGCFLPQTSGYTATRDSMWVVVFGAMDTHDCTANACKMRGLKKNLGPRTAAISGKTLDQALKIQIEPVVLCLFFKHSVWAR